MSVHAIADPCRGQTPNNPRAAASPDRNVGLTEDCSATVEVD